MLNGEHACNVPCNDVKQGYILFPIPLNSPYSVHMNQILICLKQMVLGGKLDIYIGVVSGVQLMQL